MIDSATFSSWFAAHAAAVTLYARQWMNHADAEDAVHEAFVALLTQKQEPADVRFWLLRVVRNRAVSGVRSSIRRRRREAVARRNELFEHRADHLIDARTAEQVLLKLPPEQREAVVLRIWLDLTLQEIATLTEAPVSTVHDRYRSAIRSMRNMMEATPCRKNAT